jgi:hypothetical protein
VVQRLPGTKGLQDEVVEESRLFGWLLDQVWQQSRFFDLFHGAARHSPLLTLLNQYRG